MSAVEYYVCDRCDRSGREKFSHLSGWGHRHFGHIDLCQHCAIDLSRFLESKTPPNLVTESDNSITRPGGADGDPEES